MQHFLTTKELQAQQKDPVRPRASAASGPKAKTSVTGIEGNFGTDPCARYAFLWLGTCRVAHSRDRALVEAMGKSCDFSIPLHIKKGGV